MSLKDDQDYQKYKNLYSVFWGYLILSNTLSLDEMLHIESKYKEWEHFKIIEQNNFNIGEF